MTALKRKIFWWFLVISWCGLIYYFSKSPIFTGTSTEEIIDRTIPISNSILTHANVIIRKLTHVFAFGILASLLWKALHPARWSFAVAWGLVTLYAMSDEWHQSFVPDRSGAFQDVLIDSAGALLFLGIIYLWRKLK